MWLYIGSRAWFACDACRWRRLSVARWCVVGWSRRVGGVGVSVGLNIVSAFGSWKLDVGSWELGPYLLLCLNIDRSGHNVVMWC